WGESWEICDCRRTVRANPLGSSGSSLFNFRVKVLQLNSRVLGGEVPLDANLFAIAAFLPGRGLRGYFALGGNAPVQTLAGQHTEFRLGHVEPTAMLGRMHQLQLLRQP